MWLKMSLSQQGGGKLAKSKKDSVEHVPEITSAVVELKGGKKVGVYKKESKIRFEDKIDEQIATKKAKNVYNADYKLIDDTIEDIKKASRKVSTNDYAANNVYLFLQDCLKKITLAEK